MRSCPRCSAAYDDDSKFCPVDGTLTIEDRPEHEAPDPLVGRTLGGKYRLERKLGEGGMGAVYEAEHTLLGKHVAIKVLLEMFSGQRDVLQRFQQEARTASTIGHENIIDIVDIGEEQDGRWYIVMELLKGQDLAHALRETPIMEVGRAIRVLRQTCRALQAAHEKGIIHRDMKPENVFLVQHGELPDFVKIMDFGISKVKAAHENVRLTQTGAVMGTPLYMAPEQARGDPDIDHRTDVYAVGVMAYEMLCGRPPFTGPTYVALLTQHLMQPPPRPLEVCPSLPPQLEPFLLKALEKDRDRRFGSMAEMMAALPQTTAGMTSALQVPPGYAPGPQATGWAPPGTMMPALGAPGGGMTMGAPALAPPPMPMPPMPMPMPGSGVMPMPMAPRGGPVPPTLVPQRPPRAAGSKVWLIIVIVVVVLGGAIGGGVYVASTASQTDVPVKPPPVPQKVAPPPANAARVTVDSIPPGAHALIDGRPIGITPAVAHVAHGRHQLVLELNGYRRVAQPLEIHVSDRALTVSPKLEREAAPRPPVKAAPPAKAPATKAPATKAPTKAPPGRPTHPQDSDDGHKSSPY
ncbi:MAG TPA: protein kinase [Polyangia bacterium]